MGTELHGDNRRDNLMAQPSKTLINKGFRSLKLSEVRSQGRSSRTSVQQALSSLFIKDFRPMAVVAVMGLFLSLQRRRKPPAELVRGKSLRYYGDHQRRSVNQNASCAALAAGASESLRFSSNSLLLPLRVHSLTIISALHPLLSGARSMPVYYLLAGKQFLHTVDFEKT